MLKTASASCLLALPTLVLLSGSLAAQEPKRTALPLGKKAPVVEKIDPSTQQEVAKRDSAELWIPKPIEGKVVQTDMKFDDEPNYRPAEDIIGKNGEVVEIRPIGNPYVLDFMNGSYTPPKGIDPELRRTLEARPGGYTYGFVMIKGRMSEQKGKRLQAIGLTILGTHTWQSWKAKIPAKALADLEQLDFVHWVGYARHNQKIDHNFAPVLARAGDQELVRVIVNPFESDICKDTKVVTEGKRRVETRWTEENNGQEAPTIRTIPNGRFHKALVAAGFDFQHYNEHIHAFEGHMTKARILKLLAEDWVHSVELLPGKPEDDSITPDYCNVPGYYVASPTMKPMFPLPHDQAIPMVRHDIVRNSYKGDTTAAGFIDSGISLGHTDFGIWYVYWGSATTPTSSHGTHVAGTIIGNGDGNKRYTGAAPKTGRLGAHRRFFLSRNDRSLSSNVTSFGANYNDGSKVSPYPRVVSNSYSWKSSAGYSGTEANARTVDNTIYSKRQLYVFSSGNKKATPSNFWCGSPSSAKNILTVGALKDTFNSSRTVNPQQRPSWSRWGVTDSRTKPDLALPGDETTSCTWKTTNQYFSTSGTSMSTPLMAGLCITKIHSWSWFNDKPEAIKAMAVATCRNQNSMLWGETKSPTGSGTLRRTTGAGMPNSRNMVWSSSEASYYVIGNYTFTGSGQAGTPVEITLPSDAHTARLVLCYSEPAASGSATKARINDIRASLDITPYNASSKIGDYTASSGYETVVVRPLISVSAHKGKKAKLKIWSQSVAFLSQARAAVVLIVYRKSPYNSPKISASGLTYVKPNATYTLTGRMYSNTGYSDFQAGRLWYDGAFGITTMRRPTEDGYNQYYYSSNTHTSNPYPKVGKGAGTGITVGTGTSRYVYFTLKAPASNGTYPLYVRGTVGTTSSTATQYNSPAKNVCVDGLIPKTITGLSSTSHTVGGWSNDKSIDLKWNTPGDNGCSGVYGLAYHTSTSSTAVPSVIDAIGSPTSTTQNVVSDSSSGYYFRVRARDRAVNFGAVSGIGPFKIDTVKPLMGTVTCDNGAAYNGNTYVNVKVTASDNASGLDKIRYWAGKYSAWMSYSTNRNVSWSTILTSTTNGSKTVYVQVMDKAGNQSLFKFDTIIYVNAPKITSISSSQYNLTKSYYTVNGTGFLGFGAVKVNLAQFGSTNVTSVWTSAQEDAWFAGRIRIISDTQMRIYPPQNKNPGTYSVRVRNSLGFYSNSVNTKVLAYTGAGQYMLTQDAVTAGKLQYLLAALGTHPAGTQQITMLSTTLGASTIPGVISMGIGNNWTDYFLLPIQPFSASTKNSLVGGKVPLVAKGATAYFQTVYFRPSVLPGYASVVRKTTYK